MWFGAFRVVVVTGVGESMLGAHVGVGNGRFDVFGWSCRGASEETCRSREFEEARVRKAMGHGDGVKLGGDVRAPSTETMFESVRLVADAGE